MRQLLTLQLLCCLVDNGNLPLALPLAAARPQVPFFRLNRISGTACPPPCPTVPLVMICRHILKYAPPLLLPFLLALQFACQLSWHRLMKDCAVEEKPVKNHSVEAKWRWKVTRKRRLNSRSVPTSCCCCWKSLQVQVIKKRKESSHKQEVENSWEGNQFGARQRKSKGKLSEKGKEERGAGEGTEVGKGGWAASS